MRRRFRRSASRTFPADVMSPLFRLVASLVVLALVYSWASRPQSWRWLESDSESTALAVNDPDRGPVGDPVASPTGGPGQTADKKSAPPEVVVPGPTDQDAAEAAAAKSLFEAVSDRSPLEKIEMPAYWRCMKWARAQSFDELEKRALHNVVFTKFWELPDKYRGKLIRLRLHIRRIVDWEAGENSAGVRRVYEAWGWTDESKSFPYLVVLSELPAGIPLGDEVREEGLFVGYFLKTMGYTASGKNRSSPLLIGRMKWLPTAAPVHQVFARGDWFWIGVVGIPLVLLIALGTWFQIRRARPARLPAPLPSEEGEMEDWFRNGTSSSPAETSQDQPAR
jgi:hypothetical protein